MASGKTVQQSNKTLDLWLGGTVPTVPSTLWLALFTTAPNKNGGGVEVVSTLTGYSRFEMDNIVATWPNAGSGFKTNAIEVLYDQALLAWGTIVAAALVSTASGAYTQYYWGLLSRPVIIGLGNRRRFPIGAIKVVES